MKNAIEKLIGSFCRLPGLGTKTAARMVFYLLKADRRFIQDLAEQIQNLPDRVQQCTRCGAFSDRAVCQICADESRNTHILCVVEEPQDVLVMERSHIFNGRYHVLNGTINPIRGIAPSTLNIDTLPQRIQQEGITEVIIATNPTLEGDTTALYLQKIIPQALKISRIGFGMPIGGNLEYVDRQTLERSFQYRTLMDPQ